MVEKSIASAYVRRRRRGRREHSRLNLAGSIPLEKYDLIVIGGGVIGTSVAFHLAKLGAKRVLLLERGTIGAGTTSQSSGILRTHYSVRENVELARRSWEAFNH